MLVHEVFNNKESADVVQQSVFHSGVELDGIGVLAIVAERVVHFDYLLLALDKSRLFHCSDVAGGLIPFLSAENV